MHVYFFLQENNFSETTMANIGPGVDYVSIGLIEYCTYMYSITTVTLYVTTCMSFVK